MKDLVQDSSEECLEEARNSRKTLGIFFSSKIQQFDSENKEELLELLEREESTPNEYHLLWNPWKNISHRKVRNNKFINYLSTKLLIHSKWESTSYCSKGLVKQYFKRISTSKLWRLRVNFWIFYLMSWHLMYIISFYMRQCSKIRMYKHLPGPSGLRSDFQFHVKSCICETNNKKCPFSHWMIYSWNFMKFVRFLID